MYQVELLHDLTILLLARMRCVCVWCAGMPLTSGTDEAMSLSEGKRSSMVPWLAVDSEELSGGVGLT